MGGLFFAAIRYTTTTKMAKKRHGVTRKADGINTIPVKHQNALADFSALPSSLRKPPQSSWVGFKRTGPNPRNSVQDLRDQSAEKTSKVGSQNSKKRKSDPTNKCP